jgi:LysR family glycine cleavage system transcriptional activator
MEVARAKLRTDLTTGSQMAIATSPGKRRPRRAAQPVESLRRLPLGSLRVFVASAECLNFSRAADVLGVSTAAVSMQIRALEGYLRVPLFRRNGRQVTLTPDGEILLPRVRRALQDLEIAVDSLRAERRGGRVTVSMLPSFLQQWLLPRLADFYAKYPGIDLRLETSRTLTDFLREDVQAAVRHGRGSWPNLHVEPLLSDWLVPVCTPALLDRHGPLGSTRDLKNVPLIHVLSEPWTAWPEGDASDAWGNSGVNMDDSVSAVRAAAAGHGYALARWTLAAEEVATGRLVAASKRVVSHQRSYFFVCPEAYLDIDKVVILRDWLKAQAKAFAPPPGI